MRKSRKRYTRDQLLAIIESNERLILKHLDSIERIRIKIKDHHRKIARLDKLAAAPKSVKLADIGKTEQGKANVESWNAIPAIAKAKPKAETLSESCDRLVTDLITTPAADLEIPTAFDRRAKPLAETLDVDEVAKAMIRQEQADLKKRKAAGRAARRKAKLAGELRRMPLTGKAALDAIRNG